MTDNVEILGTITMGGQTTITIWPSGNVYSKPEVDQIFSNLIDSAPTALNTSKELASAFDNDSNYAAPVQNQLTKEGIIS